MKSKIYESNNLKKYTHKNEDFNQLHMPEHLNKTMKNELVGKKSFEEEKLIPKKEYLKNTIDYLRSSYKNTNFNEINSQLFYDKEKNNEDFNEKKNKLFYTSDNYINDKKQKNSGFSEFLEKKNIYERLSDLKESIGKKENNSPIYLNSISTSKKGTEEMYERIRENTMNSLNINDSSRNLNLNSNLRRSIKDLNNQESLKNKILSAKNKLKFNEENDSNNNSNLNYSIGFGNINLGNNEMKNRSNSLFSIKNSINKINDQDSSFSPRNKDISKVNVLHKLEQYREYFKFKGL
jgi:hypothetical protein